MATSTLSESTTSPPLSIPKDDILHLVIFGRPSTGKTALLAALLQALEKQPETFPGKLTDLSGRLGDVRSQVYNNKKVPMKGDVATFPIQVEPRATPIDPVPDLEPLEVILIDCDGEAAHQVVQTQLAGKKLPRKSPVLQALRQADALLLLVDATSTSEQLEEQFEEFAQFLELTEQSRGHALEVGGWPVYLVLTKCDGLAKQSADYMDWIERIEQRKQELGARFQDFLERRKVLVELTDEKIDEPTSLMPISLDPAEEEDEEGSLVRGTAATLHGFGWIDLDLWATAAMTPTFDDKKRTSEPFGVAGLFWQALRKAHGYHEQKETSEVRLWWTAGGSVGLISGMALLMLALVLGVFPALGLYSTTPRERLTGSLPQLRKKLEKLRDQRESPDFTQLSNSEREDVIRRINELERYIPYLEKLLGIPRPDMVVTEQELTSLLEQLRSELALPAEDWQDTMAARIRREMIRDLEILQVGSVRARSWFQQGGDRARRMWSFRDHPAPVRWRLYRDGAEDMLKDLAKPPFALDEPIDPKESEVTFASALRLDTVRGAKGYAETYERKLQQVLKVARAMGMIPETTNQRAVLVVPEDCTLEQANELSQQLQADYPDWRSEMVLVQLPQPMQLDVNREAQTSYYYLLQAGRAAVLRRYQQSGSGGETKARWERVRAWLANPTTLKEGRILAQALRQLQMPEPPEPTSQMVDFLAKTSFPLRFREVNLDLPFSLPSSPAPGAELRIYHPRSAGQAPVFSLKLISDKPKRDIRNSVMTYTFRLLRIREFQFNPGDSLWATLEMRDGKQLSWVTGNRSTLYQFERFEEPPYLHQQGRNAESGTLERGVRWRNGVGTDLPSMPALMPEVQ